MSKGAFQTSRDIFENPIWQDVIKFRLFFYIVGNAVWSDEGIEVSGVKVGRGQYLRSYRNLISDLEYIENRSIKKYSLSVISKKIDQLVKENRLKIEDTELGTLFTVINYNIYQGFDHYRKESENGERTVREQNENRTRTEREQNENNNNKDNKDNKDKNLKDIKDIVLYLNQKTGKNYKSETAATVKLINGRLSDGYVIDDFKIVIDIKCAEWLNDKKMNQYLAPSTLFRPGNFEKYLNQGVGKGAVNGGNDKDLYAGIDLRF